MRPNTSREAILKAMEGREKGITTAEIATVTEINSHTVANMLKVMHRREEVYIVSWGSKKPGQKKAAFWAIGEGEDAEREKRNSCDTRKIAQSLRAFRDRFHPGPFLTSMWNLSRGDVR